MSVNTDVRPIAEPSASSIRLKKIGGKVAFYLMVLLLLVYTVFPFLWAVLSSLTPEGELSNTPISYIPVHPTLENYGLVLGNHDFLISILNSTIVAFSVTALSLIIGASASYALGRFKFRGRSVVLYTVLAMTIFPNIAVLGALYQIINLLGLYDQLPALILTYLIFTLPFTVWTLTNFFKAIPGEIEESAYVDGASPFAIFWRIMLPLAMPGLVTTGLLAFIAAWNEFLFALSFTASPDKRTITLAITTFTPVGATGGSYQQPWGQIMAASVIVTIPLVILTLIFQRRILAGLTAGAVKG